MHNETLEFLGHSLLAHWRQKAEKSYQRRKDNSQRGCGNCGLCPRLYILGLKGVAEIVLIVVLLTPCSTNKNFF